MSARLQKLINAGLTFEVVGDPEVGVSVALGDIEHEGAWIWDGTYENFDVAEHELWRAAKRHYPRLKCFQDVRYLSIYNN